MNGITSWILGQSTKMKQARMSKHHEGRRTKISHWTSCEVRTATRTRTPCRTHIFLHMFLFVPCRSRARMAQAFAVRMNLSISPSHSHVSSPSLLFPHVTSRPIPVCTASAGLHPIRKRGSRHFRTSGGEFGTWPIPRTPRHMADTRLLWIVAGSDLARMQSRGS